MAILGPNVSWVSTRNTPPPDHRHDRVSDGLRHRHGDTVKTQALVQQVEALGAAAGMAYKRQMERRKYHYRVRPYSRRNSVIWRWFVFEDRRAIESGIVTEPNRAKAEAAAQAAIERLSQESFPGQLASSGRVSQEPRPEAGNSEAI
jgi:hypothetical protein